MNYYTSEKPLKLREYGRNIQNMVDYAKTLTDFNERNALVHEITRIMTLLNPWMKDNLDYKQKLWDHFYFLADFDIDIKSDYPMPPPESVYSRPTKRMEYNNKKSQLRAYGRNISMMVEKAVEIQDPEERKALVTLICNYMKFSIKGGDRDATIEDTVLDHLEFLSNGKLRYTAEQVNFSKVVPATLQSTSVSAKPKSFGYGQQQGYQGKKSFSKFGNKKKFRK